MPDTKKIVDKAWNFAHVLRDDGLSYMGLHRADHVSALSENGRRAVEAKTKKR